jgi:hypothetical protein
MLNLSNDLAAQCLNYRLGVVGKEYERNAPVPTKLSEVDDFFDAKEIKPASLDLQLLLRNGDVRSITSESYSRLWTLDLVKSLRPALETGWMTPPARPAMHDPRTRPATEADIVPGQENFGLSVKVGDLIAPAGVYHSDRDDFILLIHPERIVDDGVSGMMRGLMLWNSEVGAGAWRGEAFLFENVCGNHILWGVSKSKQFSIKHRGRAFNKPEDVINANLKGLLEYDTSDERGMLQAARSYELGKDREEVVKTLFNNKSLGLGKRDIEATFQVAEEWEHTAKAAPTTAWGFVHGLTRYSQLSPYADERYKLDSAAGRILALACD